MDFVQNTKASLTKVRQAVEFFITILCPQIVNFAGEKNFVEVQKTLEKYLSKENQFNLAKEWIKDLLGGDYIKACEEEGLDSDLVLRTNTFVYLQNGRASYSMLFGFLKNSFETCEEISEFLHKMEEVGCLQGNQNNFSRWNGYYNPEYISLTDEQNSILAGMISNLPMVCNPRKMRIKEGKFIGGEYTRSYSPWSKKADPHTNVALDFLNKQNSIPYRINYAVWDEFCANPSFPEQKEGESHGDYLERLHNFRNSFEQKAFVIELFRKLNIPEIYFLTFFDARFRNYPEAYTLNPQGSDLEKALLLLPEEALNEEGVKWLEISIANCFNVKVEDKDLDKHLFEVRSQYFKEHLLPIIKDNLKSEAEFMKALRPLMEQADSKYCFMSQMLGYYRAMQQEAQGETPTCGCITHWDATASGLQICSIWGDDLEIMKMTNLIDPNERFDLYTRLTQLLHEVGIPLSYGRTWLKKHIYIPKNYGSVNCIKENFPEEEEQEKVLSVFNQFSAYCYAEFMNRFWDPKWLSYSWKTPDGCYVYRKVYQEYGDPSQPQTKEFMAEHDGDQFYMYCRVNEPKPYSCELAPNVVHSCDGYIARELARRMWYGTNVLNRVVNMLNHKEKWTYQENEAGDRDRLNTLLQDGKDMGMYSLRILKEITYNNIDLLPKELLEKWLIELPKCSTHVSEIHDSFGVHPNYAQDLMDQYRNVLMDVARGRFLESVLDSLQDLPQGYTLSEHPENLAEIIANSKYALC